MRIQFVLLIFFTISLNAMENIDEEFANFINSLPKSRTIRVTTLTDEQRHEQEVRKKIEKETAAKEKKHHQIHQTQKEYFILQQLRQKYIKVPGK